MLVNYMPEMETISARVDECEGFYRVTGYVHECKYSTRTLLTQNKTTHHA